MFHCNQIRVLSVYLGQVHIICSVLQFQSLDPARREALMRALNEDAAKLIAEVGEGDREMRQLRDRLNECNQNFQRLTEAVSEEGWYKMRMSDLKLRDWG